MKVTRRWLEEFISLEGISTQQIVDTFNKTGSEVAGVETVAIPDKVVVGYVKEREKHPDADKLSICQVDLGDTTVQIVCGAANVAAGQWVAVATVGAVLPGGLTIKAAKLRGAESHGMICSTSEIGLPALENGIWVLDDSIGELAAGRPLSDYPLLRDDVIEVELTANRGDCLSIHGIARELSAALSVPMAERTPVHDNEHSIGIGRVLALSCAPETLSDLSYRIAEVKEVRASQLVALRLAWVGEPLAPGALDRLLTYASHATGVIVRSYDATVFRSGDEEKGQIVCDHLNGCDRIVPVGGEADRTAIVGIHQPESLKATDNATSVVFEASYTHPEHLSQIAYDLKLSTDKSFYRSSRGSEIDISFGMDYLVSLVRTTCDAQFFGGALGHTVTREHRSMKVSGADIAAIAGTEFDKNLLISILKRLGFDVAMGADELVVTVPAFRHDIKNTFDITEEIVRMVGIDNIPSRPLAFTEAVRSNDASMRYRRFRALRTKAAQAGFFECVHFIFDDAKLRDKLGFDGLDAKLDLINPITQELNTLRTSLLPNLLLSVQRNASNSYKKIPLFELGTIYDARRDESPSMAFVWSGYGADDTHMNHGKPSDITFADFVQKISAVVGRFRLEAVENPPSYLHPYQCAAIVQDAKLTGIVGKLHPKLQGEFDIPATMVAVIDPLPRRTETLQASGVSRFQKAIRDLTVTLSGALQYGSLRRRIENLAIEELETFYPVDDYTAPHMQGRHSLTLRFHFRSFEKTLTEEETAQWIEAIRRTIESAAEEMQ